MVNDLIKAVLLGVIIYAWYWVGTAAPWVSEGSFEVMSAGGNNYWIPGLGYLFFTFLTFALSRGK